MALLAGAAPSLEGCTRPPLEELCPKVTPGDLVLSEVRLSEIYEHPAIPYEKDAVTRLITDQLSRLSTQPISEEIVIVAIDCRSIVVGPLDAKPTAVVIVVIVLVE